MQIPHKPFFITSLPLELSWYSYSVHLSSVSSHSNLHVAWQYSPWVSLKKFIQNQCLVSIYQPMNDKKDKKLTLDRYISRDRSPVSDRNQIYSILNQLLVINLGSLFSDAPCYAIAWWLILYYKCDTCHFFYFCNIEIVSHPINQK